MNKKIFPIVLFSSLLIFLFLIYQLFFILKISLFALNYIYLFFLFLWIILFFMLIAYYFGFLKFLGSLKFAFIRFKLFIYFYFFLSVFIVINFFFPIIPIAKTSTTTSPQAKTPTQEQIKSCDGVFLKIEFVSYPKKISSLCQPVVYKIKAENVGSSSLYFKDLENKKFHFDFSGKKVSTGGTNDIYKIKPFSQISPGETKIIEIYNKTKGNGFDDLPKGEETQIAAVFFKNNREKNYYSICSNILSYKVFVAPQVDSKEDRIKCYGFE